MDRVRNLRNIAIVFAIAAAVYYIPGGGRGSSAIEQALWVAFGIGICFFALRSYRERRVSLAGLGDRGRGLLYGVVGLALFLLEAHWWINEGGLRELAWFVLALLGAWAAMEVYRQSRSY